MSIKNKALTTALCCTLLLINFIHQSAAQREATSAPDAPSFSLDAPNFGQIENSVNLYTGELNFPMNLVSLPGRNGLNVSVSAFYNSNVEAQAELRNLEAPTGILGLGWTIHNTKIVVDNKQTGARDDDEFYLIEGGAPNKLVYTKLDGSKWVFEAKNYTNWKVSYDPGWESWEVIKEDGTKYIFGDTRIDSGSAIEWIIKWGNWIGSSSNTSTITEQGLAWNLAKIENTWGDAVNFEYVSVERPIKDNNSKKHTEAIYLDKITDAIGREVRFNYTYKYGKQHPHPSDATIEEYVEPHTEKAEPYNDQTKGDAYQERYEQKYLDNIEIWDEQGVKFQTIDFAYNYYGSGDKIKRTLKRIVKKNKNNDALPGVKFSYLQSGNKAGALEKITYLNGGSITYKYSPSGVALNHSERKKTIYAPSGYKEPQVWLGDDYAIVTWRQMNGSSHDRNGRTVKLYIYTWDGGWKEQFRQTISGVQLYPTGGQGYENFLVTRQKDFFAVLHQPDGSSYAHAYVSHKDEKNDPGQWISNNYTLNVGSGKADLWSGTEFFAVQELDEGDTHVYTWNGSAWDNHEISRSNARFYGTATNNYMWFHNSSTNFLTYEYLNKEKNWISKSISSSYNFVDGSDPSYWHASNSFVMVMADNNPEFIYRWSDNYNFAGRDNVIGGYTDSSPVHILNNSTISIAQSGGVTKSARFDGSTWRVTPQINGYYNGYGSNHSSFGNDLIIWPTTSQSMRRKEFNPNTLSWSSDINDQTSNSGNVAEAGNGNYFFGQRYYKRSPDGSWSWVNTHPQIGQQWDYAYWRAYGPDLAAYTSTASNSTSGDTFVHWLKNGELYNNSYEELSNQSIWGGAQYVAQKDAVGLNTMVTHPTGDMEDASSFTLWRLIDDQLSGKVNDYPVVGITTDSGEDSRYIAIDYTSTSAVYNLAEGALYNKVKVTPKASEVAAAENGYTEYYFFNGLSSSDASRAFPSGGNPNSYRSRLKGLNYATIVYDNSSQEVAKTETVWNVYTKDIDNSSSNKVDVAFYARPLTSYQTLDGVQTTTTRSYNTKGQVAYETVTGSDGTSYKSENTYYWEEYDASPNNLVAPVVESISKVNNVVEAVNVTVWKTWTSTEAPHKSYIWRRTGSSDFTAWTGSDPGSDWLLVSEIVSRSSNGTATESKDARGVISSHILGKEELYARATATNASENQIYYCSFEEGETDGWYHTASYNSTEALTGKRSFSGSVLGGSGTATGASSEQYLLSYWWKNGGNSISGTTPTQTNDGITLSSGWSYREHIFTLGPSSWVQINNSGLIDEVRFFPLDAFMTASVHDPLIGITQESDANNLIVHSEYDDFGRVELIKDHFLDIVKRYEYNNDEINDLFVSNHTFNISESLTNSVVDVNSNISWTVARVNSADTWLTFTPSSSSNDGQVTITAAANAGTTNRSGQIKVSGSGIEETITINQDGTPVPPPTLSLSNNFVYGYGNDNHSVTVTSNTEWEVVQPIAYYSGNNWIQINYPISSITGNGTVNFDVINHTGSEYWYAEIEIESTDGMLNETIYVNVSP